MRKIFLRILILFLLLLFIENNFAQRYFVKSYDTENGLPTRIINDACQDADGVMWFATNFGITSYDGFSFTNFDNTSGLPIQVYRKIRIDEKGILWAMPEKKRDTIVYLQDNEWHKIPPLDHEGQNSMLNSFDVIYEEGNPVICLASHAGYSLYKNGKWTNFNISQNKNLNYVYSVIANNRKFYLSTKIGICILVNGKPDWSLNKFIEPYGKDIIAISFENKGTPLEKLWILSEQWLGYMQYHRVVMVNNRFRLPQPSIFYNSYIENDKNGNIFFGNIWVKYFLSKSSDVPVPLMINNGFSSDGATSAFIDREQNVWLTDTRGIDKINNLNVLNYFEKTGMVENEVSAITETNDGKIILGHNKGLSIYDNNTFKAIRFSESRTGAMRVLDLLKDNKGNIWFVSSSLGLGRLLPSGQIYWYSSDKYPQMAAVQQDSQGRIWVAADRKLLYLENNKLVESKYFNGECIIRKLFPSDNGGLYITSIEGLWLLQNDVLKKIPSPPDKKAENIFSYYKDEKGTEFVGTSLGLHVIEKGKIVEYKKNGIDINSPVFFIFQDAHHNYWLGSDNGVYKWDGKNKYEVFNIYNGLAGWETNRAAGLLDSKGRIWIGTDRGLTCFEPGYDKKSIPLPVIRLLYAEGSKGTQYDLTKNNSIKYSDNTLVFHFRGISFFNEGLITYRYKLEGFDNDWQEVNQLMLNKVKYIGLKPGKYTLCVMAKNLSGNWSEISRSAPIRITAPAYLTWWFFLLATLVISGVIYGIIRIYVQKSHNARLEKEIIERNRITVALSESKQRYHDLVELLPEAIYEADCDGKLSYLNGTGYQLFGFEQLEPAGEITLQELVAPEGSQDLERLLKILKALKKPSRSVLKGIKKNGSVFPISIHTVPVLENNRCIGSRGIIIDLTEQKRFESQLKKNAEDLKALNSSKDKFFSIIAHDLRSPFTSFIGFTEILDEEIDILPKHELQTIISSMRKSASNLYQLLENLLEWSLLHREITTFEPETSLLKTLVQNCIEIIIENAKQKQIEITEDIPRSLLVIADSHMLQTIVRNLLSNAVKFTPRGGKVHIFATPGNGNSVIVAVKDTGVGIPAALLENLFLIETSNKSRGTEGELSTGLGLILCKEYVEKHGGKIWVESEEGKGSTFYFTITGISS